MQNPKSVTDYWDKSTLTKRKRLWREKQMINFMIGTGQGISISLMNQYLFHKTIR